MKENCDECGGKLEIDDARAEAVCGDCGVVFDHVVTMPTPTAGHPWASNDTTRQPTKVQRRPVQNTVHA